MFIKAEANLRNFSHTTALFKYLRNMLLDLSGIPLEILFMCARTSTSTVGYIDPVYA